MSTSVSAGAAAPISTPVEHAPKPAVTAPNAGSDRWYLSKAPIVRSLLHLCIPIALGEGIGAVYNVINAGFIGSRHDTAMLAALTFGLPLLSLVMAVGGVFGSGASTLIARLLGESENDPAKLNQIKHVSAFAMWGTVIAGVLVGGAGLLLIKPIIWALGAGTVATGTTSVYVEVVLACVPFMALSFCLDQIVRAQGAARQALVGLVISTAANLVFDVLFILVLPWGVAGAALSMGLAAAIADVYYIRFLQRHGDGVSLAPRWFTLSPAVVKPVLSIGSAALLQAGFLVLVTLLLNHLAVSYGDGPLAGFGVAMRIAQLPEFMIMGITTGVLPLLAYSYGKGDRDRLNTGLRGAALATVGVIVVFSGVIALFRDQVFGFFSNNPSVIAVGTLILTAQLISTVFNGFTGLFTAYFQAAGRALPMVVLTVGPAVLFIPFAIFGNTLIGLNAIIWSMTVAEIIACLAGVAFWVAMHKSIDAGLAEGSTERAEQALAAAQAD